MKTSITKNRPKSIKVFSVMFWILVWEVVALIIDRELYLPSPFTTFNALFNMIQVKEFWEIVLITILRVLIGFIISCVIGTVLGIICGINTYMYELFNPLIVTVKSTPVMSFIIITLLWFKSGNVPIFICFLMCLPIIWTAVVEGIKQVDKKILEMAYLFRVKKRYIIKDIYIPSIMPYLTTAMITSVGLGWKVTVAAEVLSRPKLSIGTKLKDSKVYLESPQLFAWTIVVIILSLMFEYVFKYIIRLFHKSWND
ncbi:MAG: ABC transporter permease subunit [Vallitalea sp.]|jgi:NitT/TauT family transport system permease protein|nr:ABC transporter permease subunit [Vallitalea sp.]